MTTSPFKDESSIVFSKALTLIEKTRIRMGENIDGEFFATPSSGIAHEVLKKILSKISDLETLKPVAPHSLYKFLIRLQEFVLDVELSTSSNISWPIVAYWDDIWSSLLGRYNVNVFYSLTREHNYSIFQYSQNLKSILGNILCGSDIIDVVNHDIYCLRLASIEDDNIPLYANVAHEFGHALFNCRRSEFEQIFKVCFNPVFELIFTDLQQEEPIRRKILLTRIYHVLLRFASELVSDLTGTLLAGPAFFLSLYEMSWGGSKSLWSINLSPNDDNIRAHPGFNFRLKCIKRISDMSVFFKDLKEKLNGLNLHFLNDAIEFINKIPEETEAEMIKIFPEQEKESLIILPIISSHLQDILEKFNGFVDRCIEKLRDDHTNIISKTIAEPHNVAELLMRMEKKILPNIIPSPADPLLGIPARFQDILVASSLYRVSILLSDQQNAINSDSTRLIFENLNRAERLTNKALEVSFVQQNFKKWKSQD